MFLRNFHLAAVLTSLACIGAPSVATADVVDTTDVPTQLAAWGGVAAWSKYDNQRYTLRISIGGQILTAPVAPRSEPFDLDVGPDGHGRPTIVYSRCRSVRRHGCDLYRYDVEAFRERKLVSVNARHRSEFSPAIWRNKIVFFAHREKRNRQFAERVPWLYNGTIAGKRTVRMRGGPDSVKGLRSCEGCGRPGPESVDFDGAKAVYSWGRVASCTISSRGSLQTQEIRIAKRAGSALVSRSCTHFQRSAQFVLGQPAWLSVTPGGTGTFGTVQAGRPTSSFLEAVAFDGTSYFVVSKPTGNVYSIARVASPDEPVLAR